MGFLSNIFGKKQEGKTKPDFQFYEKIIELIVVSNALKKTLKTNLKQAFEEPKSFYDDNYEFILSERGLTYPKDSLDTSKFVLIDIMEANGEMTEIDWKEEESEIRIYLNEIILAKNYDFAITYDDLYEKSRTDKIIKLIDEKELKPLGYSIVDLDIGSDSYVLTIVPSIIAEEVKMMFDKL